MTVHCHCHDQETAQVHQYMQDAVETDRKELDESKQMPAGAQSTDPGGDAVAQMEYPLQTADERGAACAIIVRINECSKKRTM